VAVDQEQSSLSPSVAWNMKMLQLITVSKAKICLSLWYNPEQKLVKSGWTEGLSNTMLFWFLQVELEQQPRQDHEVCSTPSRAET
jgi:hypothetical protein